MKLDLSKLDNDRLGRETKPATNDLEAVISRAGETFKNWRKVPVAQRAQKVNNLSRVIKESLADIIRVIGQTGKPEMEILGNEVMIVQNILRYYVPRAEKALEREWEKDLTDQILFPGAAGKTIIPPLGIIATITSWNNTLQYTFGDAICRLLEGNTVISKPSEYIPHEVIAFMQDIVRRSELDDVLQIIEGDPLVGAALVEHPAIKGIHFTGSSAMGKKIRKRCEELGKKVVIEGGGLSPMIVFPDCDGARAVNAAVWGRGNNGFQNCNAIKIVYYVGDEGTARIFAGKVAREMEKLRPGADYRPLVMGEKQFRTLEAQLQDALDRGAECLTPKNLSDVSGAAQGPPWFFPPTVLFLRDKNTLSAKVCSEETFGPILPIVPVADEEEAIRLVNENPYGLTASVWTKDDERAERLTNALDVGVVLIRATLESYAVIDLPFGGRRESGIGFRHGLELGTFCEEPKGIYIAPKWAPKRERYWFPYGRWERLFRSVAKTLGT